MTGAKTGSKPSKPGSDRQGFTLLEVLVALVVLAVGAAVTMSVLSGSLGNIRKVQVRTRVMAYAQNIMERALYREDLKEPGIYTGSLDDEFSYGYSYAVQVEEYVPVIDSGSTLDFNVEMPVRMMKYSVAMFGPDSPDPLYELQTLKMVNVLQEGQLPATQ